MGWITGIAVYLVIWWLTFFMILPIGVRRHEEAADKGHDPGAPDRPHMLKKIILNTILAAVIWGIIHVIDLYDIVSFQDFRGR